MPSIASVLAIAGLASVAVASPIEQARSEGGKFSVTQVPAGIKVRSGAIELQKSFRKFAKTVPEKVSKAAAAAAVQSGSVATNPEAGDVEWLTPVNVGGFDLMLDFDTGSSDLWVFSNELPTSESSGHTLYQVNDAKQIKGATFSIEFGDGSSAAGNVFADTVVVGGVTATVQDVEAATSVSSSFVSDTADDGLLGLAFSSLNTVEPTPATTFFDTVKSTLAQELFAADLVSGGPGVFDFGFIDDTKFNGTLDFTPVNNSSGFWEVSASGFAVGTKTTSTTQTGVVDTGTTLLLLPDATVKAFYAQVKGSKDSEEIGGFVFPCSSTLPSFSLIFDGNMHTVPPQFLNFEQVSNTECFGAIQSDDGIGFAIFGDIFLKSQYAVFDQTQASPRVGFAQKVAA